MNPLLKSYLVKIFILIILVGALPIFSGVNARTLTQNGANAQSTSPAVNATLTLATSTFSTNDSLQQFPDSIHLNITPNGGVDLNTTGIDYMVILDASGSMGTTVGVTTRWTYTVSWVNQFVSSLRPTDRLSMIIYSTTPAVQFNFSTNAQALASNAMGNNGPSGTSDTASAINMAISEYANDSTPSTPKMIYLLTDGPYSSGNDPCGYATQFKAMHAQTYINTLGAWDGSTLACLVDNSATDIFTTDTTVTYNSTLIKDNLNNFGNLSATNIELHLDMNKNMIFTYSYNPDSSISTANATTAIWNYGELRTYYYESHLNFSITFEVSGIGKIPVYYGTSYLKYTSASNTTVTINLNELDINIINPNATSTNSTTSNTSSTQTTTLQTSSGSSNTTSNSSKGLDSQPLFGILGLVGISAFWRRKRKGA